MIHKAISILRKKFLRKQFEKFKYTLQKNRIKLFQNEKKLNSVRRRKIVKPYAVARFIAYTRKCSHWCFAEKRRVRNLQIPESVLIIRSNRLR